jgi:hypothetical protein
MAASRPPPALASCTLDFARPAPPPPPPPPPRPNGGAVPRSPTHRPLPQRASEPASGRTGPPPTRAHPDPQTPHPPTAQPPSCIAALAAVRRGRQRPRRAPAVDCALTAAAAGASFQAPRAGRVLRGGSGAAGRASSITNPPKKEASAHRCKRIPPGRPQVFPWPGVAAHVERRPPSAAPSKPSFAGAGWAGREATGLPAPAVPPGSPAVAVFGWERWDATDVPVAQTPLVLGVTRGSGSIGRSARHRRDPAAARHPAREAAAGAPPWRGPGSSDASVGASQKPRSRGARSRTREAGRTGAREGVVRGASEDRSQRGSKHVSFLSDDCGYAGGLGASLVL